MSILSELQSKKEQIGELAEKCLITNIRVFSSVARGEESMESDINILVECLDGCSLFNIVDF